MNDILIEAISNFVNIDNYVFEVNLNSSPQSRHNIKKELGVVLFAIKFIFS